MSTLHAPPPAKEQMPNFLPVHWSSAQTRESYTFKGILSTLLEEKYDIRPKNFQNLMEKTGAVLAGSTPLQVVLNEFWDNSDLDLFVNSEADAAAWHGYLISEGYEIFKNNYRPPSTQEGCGCPYSPSSSQSSHSTLSRPCSPSETDYEELIKVGRMMGAIQEIITYRLYKGGSYCLVQLVIGNVKKILDSVDLGLSTVRLTVKDTRWVITCCQNRELLMKKVSYFVQPPLKLTRSELWDRLRKYERRGFTIFMCAPQLVDYSAIVDAQETAAAPTATQQSPPFIEPVPRMPRSLSGNSLPLSGPSPRRVNALSPCAFTQPIAFPIDLPISNGGPPAGPSLPTDLSAIQQNSTTDEDQPGLPPLPAPTPLKRQQACPSNDNTPLLRVLSQPTDVISPIPNGVSPSNIPRLAFTTINFQPHSEIG